MAGENDNNEPNKEPQSTPEPESQDGPGGYDWDEGPIEDAPRAFLRSAMMPEDATTMPAPEAVNPETEDAPEPKTGDTDPEPEGKAGNESGDEPDTKPAEEPVKEEEPKDQGPDPVVSFFTDLHPELVIESPDQVTEHIKKQEAELAQSKTALETWDGLLGRLPKLQKALTELAAQPDMSEDKAISMFFSDLFQPPDDMDEEEFNAWNDRRKEVIKSLEDRTKTVSKKEKRWDDVTQYYESKIKDGMGKGLKEELGASDQEAATTVKVGHTMIFGDENGRRMDPAKFHQIVYRGVYHDKLLKKALAEKEASIEDEVQKRVNAELEKANPGTNPLSQVPSLNGGQTPVEDPSSDPNWDPNLSGLRNPQHDKFEWG